MAEKGSKLVTGKSKKHVASKRRTTVKPVKRKGRKISSNKTIKTKTVTRSKTTKKEGMLTKSKHTAQTLQKKRGSVGKKSIVNTGTSSKKLKGRSVQDKVSQKIVIELNRQSLRGVLKIVIITIVVVGVLTLIDSFVQWYVPYYFVGKINGDYVTKQKIKNDLYSTEGYEYFINTEVTFKVIIQKATEEGLKLEDVTDEEMDEMVSKVSPSVSTLDEYIKMTSNKETYGLFDSDDSEYLEYQIRVYALAFKIFNKTISVTDQDVEEFYQKQEASTGLKREEYNESLRNTQGIQEGEEVELIKDSILAQKGGELVASWKAEADTYVYAEHDNYYRFGKTYKDLWGHIKSIFSKSDDS